MEEAEDADVEVDCMAKDLVCGMEVNEKNGLKTAYKGKVYYFCNDSCKKAFEKNPEKFI